MDQQQIKKSYPQEEKSICKRGQIKEMEEADRQAVEEVEVRVLHENKRKCAP